MEIDIKAPQSDGDRGSQRGGGCVSQHKGERVVKGSIDERSEDASRAGSDETVGGGRKGNRKMAAISNPGNPESQNLGFSCQDSIWGQSRTGPYTGHAPMIEPSDTGPAKDIHSGP